MKNILITGSSGYIGQHLFKQLKDAYNVDGLDIVPSNSTNMLLDINTIKTEFYKEYDAVIHLAALVNVGESVLDPISYYQTNIEGTKNILKNFKCKNFIFASTGAAEQLNSPYGISKRVAEDIVTKFCKDVNKNFTIFRFYNVIGQDGFSPTNPDGLFFNLIKAIETKEFNLYGNTYNTVDGTCIRDYVHVNEICQALNLSIEEPSLQIENLGHGKGYSVLEIIEYFKKINNVNFNINVKSKRAGDLESSVLSTVSKYMTPLYSIEELLKI
jgi:UDP-glucose 4-epimerase